MGAYWLDGRLGSHYPPLDVVVAGAGLKVLTWEGWQHRSRSSGGFNGVYGLVVHHTASSTSWENDWSYCVNASDGPVANMLLGRDGTVGIHAAGASNHAGKGGGSSGGGGAPWYCSRGQVPPDSANSYAIGIEAQNDGVGELWSPVMVDAYERLVAALCTAYGLRIDTDVVAHREWTPNRKIDPWGGSSPTAGHPYTGPRQWVMRGGGGFCDAVAARIAGGAGPNEEDNLIQYITPVSGGHPIGKSFARWPSGLLTWATNADYALAQRLKITDEKIEMGADQYENLCAQAGTTR